METVTAQVNQIYIFFEKPKKAPVKNVWKMKDAVLISRGFVGFDISCDKFKA